MLLDRTQVRPRGLSAPRRRTTLLLLLIPGVLWYVLFKYLPMAGIAYAFTDFGFRAKVSFVGLDNFKRLFASMDFGRVLGNTLLLSLLNMVVFFPLPILIALLLNEIRGLKARRAVQFVIYLPHFFSWVVVGGIFTMLLSPSNGLVNALLGRLGVAPVYFMASPGWFRWILVGSHVWRDMGYAAVIYIATLATIDPELYASAYVDGAGRLAQTWYVTLPCLRSTIATVLLLNLAGVLKIFEQILVMYNSAVKQVSDVLKTYEFTEGLLNGDIGYATAVGLFTSLVSFVLVVGLNQLSKHVLDESIM